MIDLYQRRYEASHDLWEAKATSRLESKGRMHQELVRLASEDKIPLSTMMELYQFMGENNDREEAAEAEAAAAYEEAYRDADV